MTGNAAFTPHCLKGDPDCKILAHFNKDQFIMATVQQNGCHKNSCFGLLKRIETLFQSVKLVVLKKIQQRAAAARAKRKSGFVCSFLFTFFVFVCLVFKGKMNIRKVQLHLQLRFIFQE